VRHTAQGGKLLFPVSFHSAEKKTDWNKFSYFYSSGMRLLEMCSMDKEQMTNEYEISDPKTTQKEKKFGT
jgi:hypothetical protein